MDFAKAQELQNKGPSEKKFKTHKSSVEEKPISIDVSDILPLILCQIKIDYT